MLAASIAVGTGVSVFTPDGRPGVSLSEPTAEARSLADLFSLRSPGERGAGAFTTKAALIKRPRQRAKSLGGPSAPATDDVVALVTNAPPVVAPGPGPVGTGDLAELPPGILPSAALPPDFVEGPIVFVPGPGFGGGGFIGGGGGGGGVIPPGPGPGPGPAPGPGPGDFTPPPPPPPSAPIPEPATWLTMLLGFGTLGFTLRRNRRKWAAWAAQEAR